jgi:hypothetical protein
MQADAGLMMDSRLESVDGFSVIDPLATDTAHSPSRRPFATYLSKLGLSDLHLSSVFHRLPQIKGWAMKAHEFIDSGPPVLLNNPCCCRRVVCCSFLKHAMEVQYG